MPNKKLKTLKEVTFKKDYPGTKGVVRFKKGQKAYMHEKIANKLLKAEAIEKPKDYDRAGAVEKAVKQRESERRKEKEILDNA